MNCHAPAVQCEGCPYGGRRIGSKGNPEAPIVFIGESAGAQDLRVGKPMTGLTGKIFHNYVPDDDSVYILNAMECMPKKSGGNTSAVKKKQEADMMRAVQACNPRLIEKIAAHPRKIIVSMGNAATRSITGDLTSKITQIRGSIIKSPYAEIGIIPVIHIAALMRGTGSFRQWREDIEYALSIGNGGPLKQYVEARAIFVEPFTYGTMLSGDEERIRANYQVTHRYDLLNELMACESLTCDTETTGFDPLQDKPIMIGITDDADPSVSYVFGRDPETLLALKPLFENRNIKWAFHNGKFDVRFLRANGIDARVDDDTMLMSYALDESGGIHDLETVGGDVLGAPNYKDMLDAHKKKKQSYDVIPKDVLGQYMSIDVGNTSQIRTQLRVRLRRQPDLEKLYTQTLIPASGYLSRIEDRGFYVDQERLNENDAYYTQQMIDIETQIAARIGYSINVKSPQQVAKLLFEDLKLPDYGKGSTNEKVLDKLVEKHSHPVLDLIMTHRTASKMYGTYVKGIRNRINPNDGCVHSTYLIHGTRTGRLSSRNPNVQNVPRLSRIKGTYIARPGYKLVEVDLSQAELRILTALSHDPVLTQIYKDGLDLHSDLAEYLFPGWFVRQDTIDRVDYGLEHERLILPANELAAHKEMKAANKEQRVKCKNVNFGIVYGITCFGLAIQIEDTPEVAQTMLDGWFKKYFVAGQFINKCRNAPANGQIITTCFGRKKRVGLVSQQNLVGLQNEAANFPPQSIASDITLTAGIRSYEELRARDIHIVNTVHDSIIMEVPITDDDHLTHYAVQLVKNRLETIPAEYGIDDIPFVADAEHGLRWGALEKYKLVA